jgi:hypothetical protein
MPSNIAQVQSKVFFLASILYLKGEQRRFMRPPCCVCASVWVYDPLSTFKPMETVP